MGCLFSIWQHFLVLNTCRFIVPWWSIFCHHSLRSFCVWTQPMTDDVSLTGWVYTQNDSYKSLIAPNPRISYSESDLLADYESSSVQTTSVDLVAHLLMSTYICYRLSFYLSFLDPEGCSSRLITTGVWGSLTTQGELPKWVFCGIPISWMKTPFHIHVLYVWN